MHKSAVTCRDLSCFKLKVQITQKWERVSQVKVLFHVCIAAFHAFSCLCEYVQLYTNILQTKNVYLTFQLMQAADIFILRWTVKTKRFAGVLTPCLLWPFVRLQVYVDVPGGLNLSLSLPLVIGTIPLHACATRTSSISSNCSTLSWLGLQERPEGVYSKLRHDMFAPFFILTVHKDLTELSLRTAAPPSYSDLAISESQRRDCLQGCDSSYGDEGNLGSLQTYITEFRYLPPPLYSEVRFTPSHPHKHTHAQMTSQELCELDKPGQEGRTEPLGHK